MKDEKKTGEILQETVHANKLAEFYKSITPFKVFGCWPCKWDESLNTDGSKRIEVSHLLIVYVIIPPQPQQVQTPGGLIIPQLKMQRN